MIRLIVSDMDGTLLDSNEMLPADFFEVLSELNRRDIIFVVASGRSYSTLCQNFSPMPSQLSYIAENGACVVENGIIIHQDTLDFNDVEEIISVCSGIDDVYPLVCGTKGLHINPGPQWFVDENKKYYKDIFLFDSLSCVKDKVYKVGIFDRIGSSVNSYPVLSKAFGERLNVVTSGKHWTDVMKKGVNKGNALEIIQKRLNILPEETMVFGDFYNDIQMLSKAKYSFIMGNACDDMKQYGNFIAKTNDENGVMDAIREYVLDDTCEVI